MISWFILLDPCSTPRVILCNWRQCYCGINWIDASFLPKTDISLWILGVLKNSRLNLVMFIRSYWLDPIKNYNCLADFAINSRHTSSRPTEPSRQPLTESWLMLSRHAALVTPIISNLLPVRKRGRTTVWFALTMSRCSGVGCDSEGAYLLPILLIGILNRPGFFQGSRTDS